nr:cellulosomal scaffoldin anchoring protein C [Ipomoea batatas]
MGTSTKYELISVSPAGTGTGTPSKYELMISVSPAGTGAGTPSKYELMISVSPARTGTGTPSKYELMISVSPSGTGTGTPSKYELISVSSTGTGTGTPSKYELILWWWPPAVSPATASDAKNEFISSFVSANVSSPIKFELISSSATVNVSTGDGDRDGVIIGDVVSTSKSLPPCSKVVDFSSSSSSSSSSFFRSRRHSTKSFLSSTIGYAALAFFTIISGKENSFISHCAANVSPGTINVSMGTSTKYELISVSPAGTGTGTPSKYELMISVSPAGTGTRTPSKYELMISVSPAGSGTRTPSKYELMISVSPTGTGTGTPSKYELMISVSPTGTGTRTPSKYELMISVSPTGTGTGTPSKYELIFVSPAGTGTGTPSKYELISVSLIGTGTGTPSKYELILWWWPPSVSPAAASDAKNEFISSFVSANVSSTGTPIKFELISSSATVNVSTWDGVIIGDVLSTSKSLPPFSNVVFSSSSSSSSSSFFRSTRHSTKSFLSSTIGYFALAFFTIVSGKENSFISHCPSCSDSLRLHRSIKLIAIVAQIIPIKHVLPASEKCRVFGLAVWGKYASRYELSRANASDPVLDATSSISEALAGVTLSASRNSHNSFKEHASVNTAEWPPPAASFLTSPTHLKQCLNQKIYQVL